MIFLITERHETVKEQYTDVLGKSKFDRMLLSMDCRENLGPIHPRKSMTIIIIKEHSIWAPMNSYWRALKPIYTNILYPREMKFSFPRNTLRGDCMQCKHYKIRTEHGATNGNLMLVLKIVMICSTYVKIYANRVKCLNCSSLFQVLCVKTENDQ